MTRAEREHTIAQFLEGGMTSAEEQEFYIQVALDAELRDELKAHRIIEEEARAFRDHEPNQHTALRKRTAMMLSQYPMANQQADPTPVIGSSQPIAAATSRRRSWRWAIMLLVASVITVGSFVLAPTTDAPTSSTVAPSISTPTSESSQPSTTLTPQTTSPSESPRVESVPQPSTEPRAPSANEERSATTTMPATTHTRQQTTTEPAQNLGNDAPRRNVRRHNANDSLHIGVELKVDPINGSNTP